MKKKFATLFIVAASFSLTSCDDCFLMAIIGGLYGDIGAGLACLEDQSDLVKLLGRADNAMHGENTATEDNQPTRNKSAFERIITQPLFNIGPSFSWLSGDKEDSEKFPAKAGFQMGALWQVPVSDKIRIEPGVMYSNRGFGYESEESGYYEPGGGGGSYSYSYGQKKRLHYLELPVFASGYVANGLEIFGGPQVAFLLGAKVVNESNGEVTSTERGTDGFRKVDVGVAAGVRYTIPNTSFSVSAAYYRGFTNLSSGSYAGYGYSEPKYFTNSARLGFYYAYHGSPGRRKSAGTGRMIK